MLSLLLIAGKDVIPEGGLLSGPPAAGPLEEGLEDEDVLGLVVFILGYLSLP